MADAFAIAAALTLAYLLQATVRGWWIQDRRDKAYTAEALEHTQQSTSTEHYLDGMN